MPNKTIYIAEADLPIFEQAAKRANTNLSAVIVDALKRYIHLEEQKVKGYEEITVQVRQMGVVQRKKFIGRKLATLFLPNQGKYFAKGAHTVYETAKGKYVLSTFTFPDWREVFGVSDVNAITPEMMKARKTSDIMAFADRFNYTMDVYDTLEALKAHLSTEMVKELEEALKPKDIEFLDI